MRRFLLLTFFLIFLPIKTYAGDFETPEVASINYNHKVAMCCSKNFLKAGLITTMGLALDYYIIAQLDKGLSGSYTSGPYQGLYFYQTSWVNLVLLHSFLSYFCSNIFTAKLNDFFLGYFVSEEKIKQPIFECQASPCIMSCLVPVVKTSLAFLLAFFANLSSDPRIKTPLAGDSICILSESFEKDFCYSFAVATFFLNFVLDSMFSLAFDKNQFEDVLEVD